MLDIFRGLKSLVKISHVNTDSPVFRLHYSITVMILMSFSLIVTTKQYVGNPIDCVHTKDIPEEVLNTYCWIHSTYALKSLFLKKVGSEVPYPGVGNSDGKSLDKKIYKYYQWVCFCLFFQAILFYTPRWLWKSWEGGKIHALMMDLDIGICSEILGRRKDTRTDDGP
uniref:Innexin n=1 Tax=Culex pipiens TaxID=7175 RepID=A0A8D8HQH0_CULPI